MLYVGIDPGLSGGIAAISERGSVLRVRRMPKTDGELLAIFKQLDDLASFDDGGVFAMLEHVHSTPQMGVASSFTFGVGFGKLLMCLEAVQMPYELVAPIRWQNVIQCRTPREVRAELGHKDKNINKRKAQELFPREEVTHAIADALLLAEYCRRVRGGKLFDTSAQEEERGKEKREARNTRQGTAPTPTAATRRRRRRT